MVAVTKDKLGAHIVVDPELRNAVKAKAALQGKGLREWIEELLLAATKDGKK